MGEGRLTLGDGRTQAEDPSPGLRERKKQQTKERLIGAALRLFRDRGYEGATVEAIAEDWWLPGWLDRILPRMQLEVADQPELVEELDAPSLATER